MSECLCPACSDSPKPSYSPEFRLQAEARLLLTWRLKDRQAYLERPAVQARRKELEAEIRRQWEAARS